MLCVKTIANLSVHFAVEHLARFTGYVKIAEVSLARSTELSLMGRIWPVRRTLPTLDLKLYPEFKILNLPS